MKIKNLPASPRGEKLKISQYNPSGIEAKWQEIWEKDKVYSPNLDTSKKPFYNLMMFPYPSAEGMHVGNMYAFTGADVYGRFQRMQGKDVFEPIGLDGFGIHSENYAIKVGQHPVEQAKISEKNYYKQLHAIGNGFDWTRTVETYKPEYYKWTQWLFIQLFKAGLAYRKKAPVNFCPSCKTVLADEQVIEKVKTQKSKLKVTTQNSKITEDRIGICERCETEIEKKELEQWFFKITNYADRLLNGLSQIDWAEKVKIAQRQWIGRSEGLIINFDGIDVFTTRPETTDGATFLVLSPQHSKARELKLKEVIDYIKLSNTKTDEERRKEKTGVFTGEYVINPLTKKKIPVWIADYVLMGYGTGAIMAVPAEDERDIEFAKKYKIPVEKTSLSAKPIGKKVVNYHLRDWLISRQRYWGPPIPMVYCESCAKKSQSWFTSSSMHRSEGMGISNFKFQISNSGNDMAGWFPVSENELPVELPFIKDYKPLGTGKAPLASHPEFYETRCPNCGGEAKRETDVSDTFLDSSWYFLRYLTTEFDDLPFPMEKSKIKNQKSKIIGNLKLEIENSAQRVAWLPVNMYIGGAEHSVLHLLYSRFITMVLKDLGFINFEEPFAKFRAHGLIVKDGAKMSKSKGNVVIPDEYIKKFGADTLRTYLMFMGPFNQGGDFRDSGIEGMFRFIKRVWTLFQCHPELVSGSKMLKHPPATQALRAGVQHDKERTQVMHKTIKKVTEDIEGLNYNTAIAALMEWYNFLSDQKSVSHEEVEIFSKLLAPFAPHISEELYQLLTPPKAGLNEKKEFSSIHNSSWPIYDSKFLVKDDFVIVVQVNGKLRGNIRVKSEELKMKSYIEDLAKNDPKVAKHLETKKIKKIIYIEGKVLNFVAV